MKFRKFISSAVCTLTLCLCAFGSSAEDSRLEVNREFENIGKLSPEDQRKDLNNKTMALVVITSSLDNLAFNVGEEDYSQKTENGSTTYHVFLEDGKRKLTVKHKGGEFLDLVIEFNPPLKGGEMLSGLHVFGNKQDTNTAERTEDARKYYVHIDYDDFADLRIDQQPHRRNEPVLLEEGEHDVCVSYGDVKYEPRLNVKGEGHVVDGLISGKVIVKGVKNGEVTLRPIKNAPEPNLYYQNRNRSENDFNHMLGSYYLSGQPNTSFTGGPVKNKLVKVDPRSKTVFHLDEMVGYTFLMYHGTHLQPLGFNIAYAKKFGWFFSLSCDSKGSIDTPYGKTEFHNKGGEKDTRSTSMTLTTGPMFKIYRKLYAQIGGGTAIYLSTAEPKLLTPNYEYKVGGSASAAIFYRIKWFVAGVGYTRQFVKKAYDPNIQNQLNFSVGLAF